MEVLYKKNNKCPISKFYGQKAKTNCLEVFLILEICIEIPFSAFSIYLIILLRQNYINLRDGAGEVARKDNSLIKQ